MGKNKYRNAICYCKEGALNRRKYKNCHYFIDQGFVKDKETGSWRMPTEKEFIEQFRKAQKLRKKLKEQEDAKKAKELEKTKALIRKISK